MPQVNSNCSLKTCPLTDNSRISQPMLILSMHSMLRTSSISMKSKPILTWCLLILISHFYLMSTSQMSTSKNSMTTRLVCSDSPNQLMKLISFNCCKRIMSHILTFHLENVCFHCPRMQFLPLIHLLKLRSSSNSSMLLSTLLTEESFIRRHSKIRETNKVETVRCLCLDSKILIRSM